MTTSTIFQTIDSLLPELAALAAAIDGKDAAAIALGEQVLAAGEHLAQRLSQVAQAKAGVDPALWAQIVADKQTADAAIAANAPPA